MSSHLDPITLQDLLDGELAPAERRAAESHLASCGRCAADFVAYRRVFGSLGSLPTWDPGPSFTDRVMARVLPDLAPARSVRPTWLRPFAWAYGAAVATSVAGIALVLATRSGSSAARGLAFDAVRAVVSSILFVFTSFNDALLRAADGGRWLEGLGSRLGPFARVAAEALQQPMLIATVLAAVVACGALLWWMRARDQRSWRGMHDAGLLGL